MKAVPVTPPAVAGLVMTGRGGTPVPVSAMLCGEPGALLTMLMLPVRAVALSGVKVMLTGQAMPTASVAGPIGQLLVTAKLPLAVMLVIVSSADPELPRVTTVAGLVVPTIRLPKATLGGARLTAGVGAAVTVSVRVAVPVPVALVALSATLLVPAAVGVPVMAPLVVFIVRPAGRPVALKLVGVLVAAIL